MFFITGSLLGLNDILDELKKHTDPEGLPYLQYWQSQIEPTDKAMKNGDLAGVAKIFRNVEPYIRNLVPYLKDKNLQKSVSAAADRGLKVTDEIEAGGSNMSNLSDFFESESKNVAGILKALLKTVVGLVGDVGGLVGNVLGSLLRHT